MQFNDEIVSIEPVGDYEVIDIQVSGDNLFYANDILIHNCAINKVDDVDNSAIANSLGVSMTADFMLFLLQNEEMKEKSEIVCKVTKNRFNGKTDTWMMGIDYPKMTFFDLELTNGQTFKSVEEKTKAETFVKKEIENESMDEFLNGLGI